MKPQNKWLSRIRVVVITFIVINLIYVNIKLFRINQIAPLKQSSLTETNNNSSRFSVDENSSIELTKDYFKKQEILLLINEATSSLTQQLDTITQNNFSKPISSPQNQTQNLVKEHYIPLGSGTTTSITWTEINGAEAYVDPANYPRIVGMYFEAALRIPTDNGSAYARIRNVTDKYSLFESEVYKEGAKGGLISSGKLPIPSSTKLYRVELKSTLGAAVELNNARIKIFVE